MTKQQDAEVYIRRLSPGDKFTIDSVVSAMRSNQNSKRIVRYAIHTLLDNGMVEEVGSESHVTGTGRVTQRMVYKRV